MTFYQELKEFFLKHDRDRLYMAKNISKKFKPSQRKIVMKRLEIIYKNGGPANIDLEEKYVAPVVDEVNENAEDVLTEVEIEVEGTAQEIVIETEEDEEKSGDA